VTPLQRGHVSHHDQQLRTPGAWAIIDVMISNRKGGDAQAR